MKKSSLLRTFVHLNLILALALSGSDSGAQTSLSKKNCQSHEGVAKVVCLAEAFKATLSADQLKQLQFNYAKDQAVRWSNLPQLMAKRVGLGFGSLDATQMTAVKELMASVLSTQVNGEGLDELESTIAADDYLAKVTGNKNLFSSGYFYITFLGTPSLTGLWELQFGGHHFAFANTYNGGKLTGATPSFRGIEPFTFAANGTTNEPMKTERDAFAAILSSLSLKQQDHARLTSTFRDILLGPLEDEKFPTKKEGLRIGELEKDKQLLVLNVIACYVNDLDPATAKSILDSYKKDLNETYISYAGSLTVNTPGDYIRIDGPNVWIEYFCNASRDFPGTVHPHSVWRDRSGDYGGN
jgi:hypothetical protein